MLKHQKNHKPKQKSINKKSIYHVELGDLKVSAESYQSLDSLRKKVLNDTIYLFSESEKIKVLAESYEDDTDDDEELDEKLKLTLSKIPKIRKKIKINDTMFG